MPYTLATALGLGALALDLPLSAGEVAKGLVPPAMAYYVRGRAFCPHTSLASASTCFQSSPASRAGELWWVWL